MWDADSLARMDNSALDYETVTVIAHHAHIMIDKNGTTFRLLTCEETFGWEIVLKTRISSILTSNNMLSASR